MGLIDEDALMSAVMAQEVVDKSVAKRLIIQAPTVDAVQVVRCKDCEHYEPLTDEGDIGICNVNPTGKLAFVHWFCADGERR